MMSVCKRGDNQTLLVRGDNQSLLDRLFNLVPFLLSCQIDIIFLCVHYKTFLLGYAS